MAPVVPAVAADEQAERGCSSAKLVTCATQGAGGTDSRAHQVLPENPSRAGRGSFRTERRDPGPARHVLATTLRASGSVGAAGATSGAESLECGDAGGPPPH